MNLRNTLCNKMPLWVGILWKTCSLGASEYTKARGNYVCCLFIVVIFAGPGGAEVGALMLSYKGRGKVKKRGAFMGSHKKTT